MSSTGSHIGKGGQFRNNAPSSHVIGMAPPNGAAPQQPGFVQRPFPPRAGPPVQMVGAQFPSFSNNPASDDVSPVSLSFGDLNVPNRAPSTSAPYPNPAFPPNLQHPSIPILPPQNHMGPGGSHGMTRPPLMRPAPFTMPSMPLGIPPAMANGPPGMMPPHLLMMPGMPPPGFYGMPQPPPGSIQPPLPNESATQENVLIHMNRKKNVLKFFPADDSQQAESKDAPLPPSASTGLTTPASAPASTPASTPASAPLSSDDRPSVAKTEEPSPRANSSSHTSGGSPRAAATTVVAPSFADKHSQHNAVPNSSDVSSIPTEVAAPASRSAHADDAKNPAPVVAVASQNAAKPLQSQTSSRASLNLLGSSLSPSAPSSQQPRSTPSAAAHRGQAAASLASAQTTTAPSRAGRTVYTRELLLELKNSAHHSISPQTLDRIKHLKLDMNFAAMAGAHGGKATQLPFSTGRDLSVRRLPIGKVVGAPRAPQQKHSISENSFIAKMEKQKMSDDVVEKKKKNIQLILNQLTSENFQKLCEKLYKEIDCVETLEIVQTKIYDKAVLDQQQNPAPGQPTFVELYARLCQILVQDNQPINPATGEPGKLFFHPDQPSVEAKGGQFRRSLLNRCQEEFERPSQGRSEDWQQLSEDDRYIKQMKEKRRALGNVDFVGQLFLHGLLAEKTLHHCFKLLLEKHYVIFENFSSAGSPPPQDSDFDQLESFCKLLTTVGRTIERPQAKQFMDSYFGHLQQIMGQPTIIPRMKFHIEQIIELRRCNWDSASMRQERCMPSSIGKSQKASVAPMIKSTPGTGSSKAAPALIQSKPAPASSKPTTTPAKQPQSSKPNGKMPAPSLSNSAPCASSPAVPKVDLMLLSVTHFLDHRDEPEGVDAEHMRSLVSMLEEWKCNHIHSEVADCLCELNQPYTHALFVHDIVTQCCDRGPSFFLKCAELLETLSRKQNCLNEAKLEEALMLLGSTGFVEEMRLDFPGYLDFFALIVARGSLC